MRYHLAVADGALRAAGSWPNVLVRYPNGVGGEFFYQKRAPTSRPDWIEVVSLRFPSGRSADENRAARRRRARPGTGSRSTRASASAARRTLATSKWWKEERHGYNQNAKDRTVASAYAVRPTLDARVSAPLAWDEVPAAEPVDFTLATMPEQFAKLGDRHAGIDGSAGSLAPPLELSARQEREGQGDAPWATALPEAAGRAAAGSALEADSRPPPRTKTSTDRDRPSGEEAGRARWTRALEGPPSRSRGASGARRHLGGRDAGPVHDLDPHPREPRARSRGAAPGS